MHPPHQFAAVPIGRLRHTIPITGSGARFSPIRFLLTGAAPNMGTRPVSFVRRAAKQKTLCIIIYKQLLFSNRGITPGSSGFFGLSNAGEYDSLVACHRPPVCPICHVLSWKLCWTLSQMDLAGGTFAAQKAQGQVATVSIEAVRFLRPVAVGDEVSCYCSLGHKGGTSVAVRIETWARDRAGSDPEKVTEGVFTYVALDEHGKPRELDRNDAGT